MPTQEEIDAAKNLLTSQGFDVVAPSTNTAPNANDVLDLIRLAVHGGVHCQDGDTVYMWLETDDLPDTPGSSNPAAVSGTTWLEAANALLKRVQNG